MKLNQPKVITWWIGLILAVLGLIGNFAPNIPVIGGLAFWLVLVSAVLMLAATYLEGL